jgi:hypothetical protein
LHPDIVKAAFSLPISMLCKNPVHSHIVASWMPRWAQVEYEKAMTKRLKVASTTKLAPGLTASEANKLPESLRPSGAEHYNKKLFWHEYAAPMMEQTLREDGMWTEVFDPKQAREDWRKQPEELAIMAQLPQTLAELARRARNVDTNLR